MDFYINILSYYSRHTDCQSNMYECDKLYNCIFLASSKGSLLFELVTSFCSFHFKIFRQHLYIVYDNGEKRTQFRLRDTKYDKLPTVLYKLISLP